MQFRVAAKIVIIVIVAGLLSLSAGDGQQSISSSAKMVPSPDGVYQTCWVDVLINPHLLQRRFIFVVETASNRLIFNRSTVERYTGAAWNRASTACAIFDAPDNANVYLWILRKPVDPKVNEWSVKEVDVEKLSAEKAPEVLKARVVRIGVEKVTWNTDDVLEVALLVNNKPVTLNIPAM